jgi:hypothetical protein
MFECDTCPVAAALAGLDPANREAWAIFQKVVTRLTADLQVGGVVLERLTREYDGGEFDALWRRLGILYDILCPPPSPPKPTES